MPTVEEFAGRIRRTTKTYPYLVAEAGGELVGYAYAGAFHSRPAYGWAIETTIYVKESCRRQGVGKQLYQELERE